MSRWLLTADLQFDSFDNYSTQLPSGITSRLSDMIRCWEWMTEVAQKHACDGIIAVGDIFDSRTVLELPVLDQVCRAVHASTEKGLEIHFVAGNHDSYLRSPVINSLQVFKGMATIWDKPGVKDVLGFLPWSENLPDFKMQPELLYAKGARFLFAHIMVKGAVHSAAGGLPPEALHPELFSRVLLGDVHEPVDLTPTMCYIASPMQLDFGDAGGKRGVRILDDVKDKLTFIENDISPRFHIITEPSQVAKVKPGDFVKVRIDDLELTKQAATAAKGKTSWVESSYVDIITAKPRVDVRSSQDQAEILKRYTTFKGFDDPEILKVGLELIEKAKALS